MRPTSRLRRFLPLVAGRARGQSRHLDDESLLPPPRRHAQKKTLIAGSCGHNAPQSALAKPPEARRCFAARVHRRDLDQDQHDTGLRLGSARRAYPRRRGPGESWKTATFLAAALRNDRIRAPCVFDGPINGERFRAYVEQFLIPTLKPNDIVILDNLGSRKEKPCGKPFGLPALASCFFPNTRFRPQSDRTGLRQDQRLRSKGCPRRRSTPFLTPSPKPSRRLSSNRMQKLSRRCRRL